MDYQFVYTENGVQKSSVDEYKRRVEIAKHNQQLQKDYPIYTNREKVEDIER